MTVAATTEHDRRDRAGHESLIAPKLPDDPRVPAFAESVPSPSRSTAWLGAVVVALGVLALLGVVQFVDWSLRREVHAKQLLPVSPILTSTQSAARSRMSRYRWVDPKKDVVRIPVERARELVLGEYGRSGAAASPPPPSGGGRVARSSAAASEP
jgi:hypothetical protein